MKTSLCKSRLNSARAYTTFKPCGKKGLSGHADLDIWEGAQREGRVLITQDLDFLGRAKVCARDAPRDPAHTPALAQPTELNRSCHRAL